MESTEIDRLCLASSSTTGLLLFAAGGGDDHTLPPRIATDGGDDGYQPLLGGRDLASKRGAAGASGSVEINPTESGPRRRRTTDGTGPGSRWELGGHQRRGLVFTDDSSSFADYTPTTVDPGNTLTILAVLILVGSLVLLPVFVKFGKYVLRYRENDSPPRCCRPFVRVVKIRRRYHGRAGRDVEALDHRRRVMSRARRREARESLRRHRREHIPESVRLDSPKSAEDDGDDRWEEVGGTNTAAGHKENGSGSRLEALEMVSRSGAGTEHYDTRSEIGTSNNSTGSRNADADATMGTDGDGSLLYLDTRDTDMSALAKEPVPAATPLTHQNRNPKDGDDDNDAVFVVDPATNAPVSDPTSKLTARGYIHRRLKFLWSVVRYDFETRQLMRLAVPFTAYALVEGVCDIIGLIIVSHRLGTDSLIALAMVDIFLGTTAEFVGGWVEASSSLVSMAYGAGNYRRAGQYLQVSVLGYVLGQIPMAILWGFATKPLILFLGLGETAGDIAQEYAWVVMAIDTVGGVHEAFGDFLEVVGLQWYTNAYGILEALVGIGAYAAVAYLFDANLTLLGLVDLCVSSLFFCADIAICSWRGWLDHFEVGMFGDFGFHDRGLMLDMFKVALPLAFGSLFAYAEWEVLTFFAAVLGPAEAVTWAVAAYIWDIFEVTTGSIADAAEVRCSYQLGKGRPKLAELSAYKAIFLAFAASTGATILFLSLGGLLPGWMTTDPTIQAMLSDLFPLMALGNITMNTGWVCWSLIGAQGRYHIGTFYQVSCSLFITIPLSAMFTLWLNIDLRGLTFSVLVGYCATITILTTILLMSDWVTISAKIREKVKAEEEEDDEEEDGDESNSSDSSSSSSSS